MTTDRAGTYERLGYRPELDGIRALAVILVLWNHLGRLDGRATAWVLGNPSIGVDIFFTLSGFLITRLMMDEYLRSGELDVSNFLWRRARRLLPASLVVVGSVLVAATVLHDPFGPIDNPRISPLRASLAALGYHMNLIQSSSMLHHDWALTHTWSLSLEEQFYLIWPFVMWSIVRYRRGSVARSVFFFSLAIVVGSTLWRWTLQQDDQLDHIYNGLDTRAVELALGVMLAVGSIQWPRLARKLHVFGIPALVALLILGAVRWIPPRLSALEFLIVGTLTVFLIAGCLERTTGLARVFRIGGLVELGKISYSVYLVHYPVFFAVGNSALQTAAPGTAIGVGLGVTFLLAFLLYRGVETRFRATSSTATAREAITVGHAVPRTVPPRND